MYGRGLTAKQADVIGERFALQLYQQANNFDIAIQSDLLDVFETQRNRIQRALLTGQISKALITKKILEDAVLTFLLDNGGLVSTLRPRLTALLTQGFRSAGIFAGLEPVRGDVPLVSLQRIADVRARKIAPDINAATSRAIRDLVAKHQGNIADLSSEIDGYFTKSNPTRALRIARTETTRMLNTAAETSWELAGVLEKQWYTTIDGRECQWCRPLHMMILSIGGAWYGEGDDIIGDQDGRLRAYDDITTPPVHPYCRCVLLPVLE